MTAACLGVSGKFHFFTLALIWLLLAVSGLARFSWTDNNINQILNEVTEVRNFAQTASSRARDASNRAIVILGRINAGYDYLQGFESTIQ